MKPEMLKLIEENIDSAIQHTRHMKRLMHSRIRANNWQVGPHKTKTPFLQ